MSYWAENWILWVSAFCVLAIYSYLIKDNVVYRTMMQVFIGINVGYFVVVQWRDVLLPRWWLPMTDGFAALFGQGEGSPWGALWALVGVLGLLYYFQLSRKYFWISRIVIGVTIGIGAGLTFKSQLGQNLPQVADSFKPLAPAMVQSAPRRLFELPGSPFAPAVDGPVAYFASASAMTCVETMSGWTMARQPGFGEPAGSPIVSDGAATFISKSLRAQSLKPDGTVGTATPGPFDPAVKSVVVTLPPDRTASLALVPEQGAVRAMFEGKELWRAPGVLLGGDQGCVFTSTGARLRVLDGATGEELLNLALPGEPTGSPAIADFRQPAMDRGVLLVPVAPGLRAYALRDGVAKNVRAGDPLWEAAYPEPVLWAAPQEGVVMVGGVRSGEMWEIPDPQAVATTSDYFDNWVFVLTMLTVMTYFFFSFRQEGKVVKGTSKVGRWMLMIGFGAFFGNTVMTRMSYLLDRLMFLIDEWLRPFFSHLFG